MRKDLRAYVRVDASNRVIPGSLVLRKPGQRLPSRQNGTWLEVQTYVCCAPPGTPGGPQLPITVVPPDLGGGDTFAVEISNGNMTTGIVDSLVSTASALVTWLTTNYPDEGTYVLDGTDIIFTPAVAGTTLEITVAP